MLLYLDNWTSVRNAPNENQGRELLELHTVGRGAGYTEQMVKDSAKILSGYTVDAWKTWAPSYDAGRHTTGAGPGPRASATPTPTADGSALTVRYLRYLAHHPATATRIATKLCRHFVADAPSDALVDRRGQGVHRLRHRHQDHPARTGRAPGLPGRPRPAGAQPDRGLRRHLPGARRRRSKPPTGDQSFARACVWVPETTLLYQWPRPDGLPLGDAAWSSATRMLNSFRMHWNLAAAGGRPRTSPTATAAPAGCREPSLRLDEYVDHLCRSVLGKPADARTVGGRRRRHRLPGRAPSSPRATRSCGWMHVRVMGVLLDSPDHMSR